MDYDFSELGDMESYVSVPEGTYLCKVTEVRVSSAKDQSERWRFRLEVVDGDCAGRTAAWDSMTWSERGVFRVKDVLRAMGFDVSGRLEIRPDDLEGKQVLVQVHQEEYVHPETGVRRVSMAVPYDGYAQPRALAEFDGLGESGGARGEGVDLPSVQSA